MIKVTVAGFKVSCAKDYVPKETVCSNFLVVSAVYEQLIEKPIKPMMFTQREVKILGKDIGPR